MLTKGIESSELSAQEGCAGEPALREWFGYGHHAAFKPEGHGYGILITSH